MGQDPGHFAARIKSALPRGWFGESAPVLDAVLSGFAASFDFIMGGIGYLRRQSRVSTASGAWLNAASLDYFGPRLPRHHGQADDDYRTRIAAELRRERVTRSSLQRWLRTATGVDPLIFEPANSSDTGGYGGLQGGRLGAGGGLAYAVAGGWGNLGLSYQVFVTVHRSFPGTAGVISGWGGPTSGYGTGGLIWNSSAAIQGYITDSDVMSGISENLPVCATAWVRFGS